MNSWRDHIKVHPAADLFPMMSDAELKELGEDIKRNGLSDHIYFWFPTKDAREKMEGGYLLDGRNRLEAMERAGLKISFDGYNGLIKRFFAGDDDRYSDPYAYVISANIQRRHLTTEQRIELTAKVVKAQPEKSDRQIAKQVKVSPTTVGKVRADLEAKGVVSTVDTRTDARGRKQPARKTPVVRTATKAAAAALSAQDAIEATADAAIVGDSYAMASEIAADGGAADTHLGWTSEQQDQMLNLVLKLLVTVDRAHRKKFFEHLRVNSLKGVYVPTCGHRGWKSGRQIPNLDLIKRIFRAIEIEWDEAAPKKAQTA